MMIRGWTSRRRRRASGFVVAAALIGAAAADASHSTPPPPPPPGHGQVLVRVVRAPSDAAPIPEGEVKLDAVELHRAGAGPEEGWVPLPPLRPAFATVELMGGQVWVANAPVATGQFDRVRMGARGGPAIPLTLHLASGQWTTLTLEVRVQPGLGRGPLSLELRRARILTAQ